MQINDDRTEEVYDDEGRCLRPAFAAADNGLTIFRDHVARRRYVERNRYTQSDGFWRSEGLPTCRDVIVRADLNKTDWVVVPEEETSALRSRVYPVQ
jgi:hypothetical protein